MNQGNREWHLHSTNETSAQIQTTFFTFIISTFLSIIVMIFLITEFDYDKN